MSTEGVDNDAIQRLAAESGDPEARKSAAKRLGQSDLTRRTELRALVQGLWDDDASVRSACESAIQAQFQSGGPETRSLIIDILFMQFAGTPNPPQEAVTLLFRVVTWARQHSTAEPNLFAAVLSEAERARKGGCYARSVRRVLKSIYQESSGEASRSDELLDQFSRRRAVEQLRSETAPPDEVEGALRRLGDQSIEETDLDVLLYNVIPLKISHNYQVMNRALENFQEWTAELPAEDNFDLTSAVEELKAYRRGQRETLPGRLRNEMALSEVAVEALVDEIDRYRTLARYERLLAPVIDILDGIDGVRENVETVSEVAVKESGDARTRAIKLLCSLLTGLDDTDSSYNESRIRRTYDQTTEVADRQIRETFEQLVTDASASETELKDAVRAYVRSRPDNLNDRLERFLAGRPADDPIVEATIQIVADEAVLTATAPVVDLFERLQADNPRGAIPVAETLEAMGHDAARRALQTAMEDAPEVVAEQARESLIKAGYYEQVRASDIRGRSESLAEESETTEQKKEKRKQERREVRREYKRVETDLRQQVYEGDQILRRGLVNVLERRIDGMDTLADLYLEDRRVEQLIDSGSSLHSELGAYLRRMSIGGDIKNGIEEEIATIEQDLEYLESLVKGDGDRASTIETKLRELDQGDSPETIDSDELGVEADDAERQLQAELRSMERKSLQGLRDGYRSAADDRRDRIQSLRTQFEQKRSQFQSISASGHQVVTDIQSAIDLAETRANRIKKLTAKRQREWSRVIDEVERRNQELGAHIEKMKDTIRTLESKQRRIDDLTEQIGEARVRQQHLGQRSHEDRDAYEEFEPLARGEARHQARTANEREEFFKHRHIYSSFIRRYYEMQLDAVSHERFKQEHGELLAEIREEVEQYDK
jgi:hypothetical protein